jgi:peptidoglycan/xylan/chitin deacetylase (PgdA/CDA1 family)
VPWLRDAAKEVLHACLREQFVWRLPAGSPAIALTFDDGPHPEYTPAVLGLLARLDIRATFFVVGRNVARFPDLVRRIADEGHTLGGHTFEHLEITALSPRQLERELETCRRAIQDAAKIDTVWFRPPRGRVATGDVPRLSHGALDPDLQRLPEGRDRSPRRPHDPGRGAGARDRAAARSQPLHGGGAGDGDPALEVPRAWVPMPVR